MKRFLAVLCIIVLLGVGVGSYYIGTQTSAPVQTPEVQEEPEDDGNIHGLQTYKNSSYGFEFLYPVTLSFATPSYGSLDDKVVQLDIPKTGYENTNFGSAAFTVSAQYTLGLEECLSKNMPEGSSGASQRFEKNNIVFYRTTSSGAAAGNWYETTVYRTYTAKKVCIELTQTIHTTNIGNYPEGSVMEVDKTIIQNRLDQMFNTFKLDESNASV